MRLGSLVVSVIVALNGNPCRAVRGYLVRLVRAAPDESLWMVMQGSIVFPYGNLNREIRGSLVIISDGSAN